MLRDVLLVTLIGYMVVHLTRPRLEGEPLAEQLRASGSRFATHIIDLDRFKEINDTFGHEAGDALIRAAAGIFATACGAHNFLARLGGDEFAII